jgi:hypothetical protein
VNCMVGLRLFTCERNSFIFSVPCGHTTNVSSTYLSYMAGLCGTESRANCSGSFIKMLLVTGERELLPIAIVLASCELDSGQGAQDGRKLDIWHLFRFTC